LTLSRRVEAPPEVIVFTGFLSAVFKPFFFQP